MNKLKLHIVFLIIGIGLLYSCHWDGGKRNGSSGDITVFRYDKLLNEYVELNSFSALQKMNTDHALETKFLIEDVLRLGQVNDTNINRKLKEFYSDPTLKALMKEALEKFEDMSGIEKELSKGFYELKREIPSVKIPRVYSQMSALNESVVVGDSILGFSIDKYMGQDYPLYKRYYYDYQCKSMSPDRIVPDCFTFYLLSEYPLPWEEDHTLLNLMMHRGKIHYVVKKILDYPSYAKEFGYTPEEFEWCKTNRKAAWEYMVQNGHLYTTDPMIIRKYTAPSPYTAFFGENSPAMVGIWMGIQIIDSYMKKNKSVSIQELMRDTDYSKMLADADFKP